MAIEAARLSVIVDAETAKAEAQLRQMDGTVGKTEASFGKLSGAVKGFALGGGLLAAGSVMMDMAQAAAADAASVAQLDQAVTNAEGGIRAHSAALDEAVAAGQRLAFSDDQTRAALSLMTATTGDADEALRRLSSAQNLARGTGMDLVTAAKLLGRVNDENINVLSRYGIQVDKTATAQDLLNAVDQKFAGQAGTYAETDAAKFARMTDSIDEAKESLGSGLLPVMAQMAGQVTTTANGIQSLVSVLEALPGGTDSATAATKALSDMMVIATGGSSLLIEAIGGLGGMFGEAEAAGVPFATFVQNLGTELTAQQGIMIEAANGAAEYSTSLSNLRDVGNEALQSQQEYTETLGRQAEQAGLANERNTEALHSIELVGGAAAEAAFGLDQMSEATERAWAAQDKLTSLWGDAQKEMGFWEENLSNAESALELLTGEMEENGSLTAEQQAQYDILTGAVGRYQGGIEDSEGAVINAAVAQADFIRIQDDLNTKLADGTITQADYNRSMGEAVGAIDPAAGASYGLATAQQTVADTIVGVVEKIQGLLEKLGLIPAEKSTDISAPGATEAAGQVHDLGEGIGALPSSFTITANVDIQPAVNALGILEGFIPHSPAERGPLAFTPDWSWLTAGAADDMEPGIRDAVEKIKSHLTSIDLDNILGDQADLGSEIANLTALRDGLAQLGDTQGVQALNEEIALLQAEMASLVGIIGTDAVQAWIANQNAAQLAAEAAEANLKAQEEATKALAEAQAELVAQTQKVVTGLAAGGEAAASFLSGLVADATAAQAAFDLGALLGVSPEALAELSADLAEAEGILAEGTAALQNALLAGVLDEATIQALAEAGGVWFQTLYDQLFGEGALAALEAGWNDLSQVSIDALAALIPTLEDGGAEIIDTLVSAISEGAIGYEAALALLGDATGEQVAAIIAELEQLEAALVVQLAEALLAGSDPSGIEANLAVIEQLLADLAGRATETAEAVVKAGKSMGVWSDEAVVAEAASDAVADSIDNVGRAAQQASKHVSALSRSLEDNIETSFVFTGNDYSAWAPGTRDNILNGVIERMRASQAIDPEAFADAYINAVEGIQSALQKAVVRGEDQAIDRLTAQYQEMVRVAAALGIDLADALGTELDTAATKAQQQLATTLTPTTVQGSPTIPLGPLAPLPPHIAAGGGARDTTVVAHLTDDQINRLADRIAERVGRTTEIGTARGAEAGTLAGFSSGMRVPVPVGR